MQNEILKLKLAGFAIEKVELDEGQAYIEAHSLAKRASCPLCGQISQRVHSWYSRHPQDLPWCGLAMHLHLHVQKFFCDNLACPRKIFVERLPQFVPVQAQKTERLQETLRLLAFALGGEQGARLLTRLAMKTSPDSLLRLVRQQEFVSHESPRVLGVDDWAYRRGRSYGTILCDLEREKVLDLLPDREAKTLAQWLKKHPSIEIVSRDRAAAYIEGITLGAPQAIQVADRWHLLKNLREATQKQLEQWSRHFEWSAESENAAKEPRADEIFERNRELEIRLKHRQQRFERYQAVISLRDQGYSQQQVAAMVDLSLSTIKRFWRTENYPERQRRLVNSSLIDPFQAEVLKAWDAGQNNIMELWRKLQLQGFSGSYLTVFRAWQRLEKGLPLSRSAEAVPALKAKKRRRAQELSWLFVLELKQLSSQQVQDLENLWQAYPQSQVLYRLVREFREIFQNKKPEELAKWLQKIPQNDFKSLQSFAKGLRKDLPAIEAALRYDWSNGYVEGQVNRLKLIKRQMYGRANFDLLRQKVLMRL